MRLIDADQEIEFLNEMIAEGALNDMRRFAKVILKEAPTVEAIPKADYENRLKVDMVAILDKIRAEILDCLEALDEVEKSGLSIYLPDEISGRRLTYQQCLGFIDKYKEESEVNND